MAGIIAARPPAGSGIAFQGVAPDAGIASIRQSSANYQGKDGNDPDASDRNAGTIGTLAQAIVHAANMVPGGVINMSVDNCRRASDGPISQQERQLQAALRFAVEERNVVPVASAGNLADENSPCHDQNNGPDASRPGVPAP